MTPPTPASPPPTSAVALQTLLNMTSPAISPLPIATSGNASVLFRPVHARAQALVAAAYGVVAAAADRYNMGLMA